MDKQSFDLKFESIVVRPLVELGFNESGKSLYMVDGQNAFSLIRLGGRMAKSGGISHILCFRHSFLPNLEEVVPSGFEREVFSYPIKLRPLKVKGILGAKIKYVSSNLNFDYETYEYESKSNIEVEKYLRTVFEATKILIGWAKRNPVSTLAKQIEKNNTGAWIEKEWMAAYAKQHMQKT
jgi:hypothetical protein